MTPRRKRITAATSGVVASHNNSGRTAIGPITLKVLALLMSRRRPCLFGEIKRQLGTQLNGDVLRILHRLSHLGLVRYEPSMRGTIRAACYFIPADQL